MSRYGAEVRFVGAVADRPDLVDALLAQLAGAGLAPVPVTTGPGRSWTIAVPGAADAATARDAVSTALREAGAAVGTCLAVSVRGVALPD